jgi:hypothetical protein
LEEKKETNAEELATLDAPVVYLIKHKPEIAEIKAQGSALFALARDIAINNAETRAGISEIRERARQLVKDIDEKFDKSRDTAHKIYQLVLDGIKGMKADPEKAIKIANSKMSDYDMEQDRIAAAAKAEADRKAKEIEDREREKLLKRADKAEEKGNEEKAEDLRAQADDLHVFIPSAPGPEKTTHTESGSTSGKKDFDVFIIEPMTIIREISAGHILPGVIAQTKSREGYTVELKITAAALKKHGEMHRVGAALPVIPGCRVIPKISYSGRAAANGK